MASRLSGPLAQVVMGWLLGLFVALVFAAAPLLPALILICFPDIAPVIDQKSFNVADIKWVCLLTGPIAAVYVLWISLLAILRISRL